MGEERDDLRDQPQQQDVQTDTPTWDILNDLGTLGTGIGLMKQQAELSMKLAELSIVGSSVLLQAAGEQAITTIDAVTTIGQTQLATDEALVQGQVGLIEGVANVLSDAPSAAMDVATKWMEGQASIAETYIKGQLGLGEAIVDIPVRIAEMAQEAFGDLPVDQALQLATDYALAPLALAVPGRKEAIQHLKDAVTTGSMDGVVAAFDDVIKAPLDRFESLVKPSIPLDLVTPAILELPPLHNTRDGIKGLIKGGQNAGGEYVHGLRNAAQSLDPGQIYDAVTNIPSIDSLGTAIEGVTKDVASGLGTIGEALSGVTGVVGENLNKAQEELSKKAEAVVEKGEKAVESIKEGTKVTVEKVVEVEKKAEEHVQETLKKAEEQAKQLEEKAEKKVVEVAKKVEDGAERIKQGTTDMVNRSGQEIKGRLSRYGINIP
jgi:F0F1-type ATP synthase membrane subunit b/b'